MSGNKETKREELYQLLGELPPKSRNVNGTMEKEEEKEHYILEKWRLDLNGLETVPAYFVKPKDGKSQYPVILFSHSHGGRYELGKDELIKSNVYLDKAPYAEELTKLGYAVLTIDHWGFGERSGKTESAIFKEMLWKGQVMWGMMVYDSLKAIDYLTTRTDVDHTRIGALGMSMGSTMSWWAAALDERIKVCVDICCLSDYQSLIDHNTLDHHGIYYYVPRLMMHFTAAEINALITPRPHLGLAGTKDPLTPLDGLKRIDEELRKVYRDENATDAWKLSLYDVGHTETKEMRQEILAFLKKWL